MIPKFFRDKCWVLLLLFLLATAAHSETLLDLDGPIRLSNWQVQDGLPSNKVLAVLQTRDGYIWAGTFEGLARFDGYRFKDIVPDLHLDKFDTSVTALVEGPEGALWIGHADGSTSRYFEGRFERFEVSEKYKGTRVHALAVSASGEVWSLSVGGVLIRVRDGFELVPETGSKRGVFDFAASENGDLWINSRGRLSSLREGVLREIELDPSMSDSVLGLARARQGGVWVVVGEELWKFRNEKWEGPFGQLVTGRSRIYSLRELSNGQLIAGTFEQGAVMVSTSPFRQRRLWRETSFPSDWIFASCEDREGGLWLATGTAGLVRVTEEKVRIMMPEDGWAGHSVLSVTQTASGDVWATTEGAGVYRYRKGEWTHFSEAEGVENAYVWSVCESPEGRLLLGTWGLGLFEQRGDRFARARGFESLDIGISAMLPSAKGGVLVGSLQGLLRYVDDQVFWIQNGEAGGLRDVRYILEDPDGTIWVACNGDGLGRIDSGGRRVYTRSDGLSTDYLRCLFRSSDGSLWIGTRGMGLNRFKDGHFAVISREQGLFDETISHIEEDDDGNLWIGTRAGIMRVALTELNACADGVIDRVNPIGFGLGGAAEMLVCSGPLQPSGARLQGGDIVFPTGKGVARIDPSDIRINSIPPPVAIQSIKVGNRIVYDGGLLPETVEAVPGENRLEISYVALSFDAPETLRFHRELSGPSTNLEDTVRERSVIYTFLPPGDYSFLLTAANGHNVWSTVGASVSFVFQPYYWQTAWFRNSVVLAIVFFVSTLVWQIARMRHRKTVERIERSQALEQERSRIANDMHDDLGANLTRITMLSETARSERGDIQKVWQGLDMIYDTARNLTLGLDEIVWAVNPRHDSFDSLIAYFEKFALDLLSSAGMKCRLEMPLEKSSWRPSSEIRHNLFLAFKEALNNAVRHSGGTCVTVSVEVDRDSCRVSVSDDGFGISESPETRDRMEMGSGLRSMRERMGRIRGTFEMRSSKEGGSETVFSVPVVEKELKS